MIERVSGIESQDFRIIDKAIDEFSGEVTGFSLDPIVPVINE